MPRTPRKPPFVGPATDPALVLEQVTHGYVLLDDAVIAFADADQIAGLALLVGRRTDLPAHAIERALEAKSPGPATLLCRAAGLGANGFSAVLRMRRRLREEDLNPAHALANFLQTPVEVAQGVADMMTANEERRSPAAGGDGGGSRESL
ncbi:MAG TPA: hypothetical protein VG100_00800 [Xanthobacteraceae bacterium]|jgi:hypothetical protein|nr:hypothetical protein [Xanthobacteraceae bacterium]